MTPSNGAPQQPKSPLLSWESIEGANSYRLQISSATDFSGFVWNEAGLTATARSVGPLDNMAAFCWRVSALRGIGPGDTTDWSSAWSFTTSIAKPEVPSLASPAEGAAEQPLATELFLGNGCAGGKRTKSRSPHPRRSIP